MVYCNFFCEEFTVTPSQVSSMAGAARGQFAMMRVVRQGCPASGYLFTMALPPESHRPWFLQRSACACADDFALATACLRESWPKVAGAFATRAQVTGNSFNYWTLPQDPVRDFDKSPAFQNGSTPVSPVFRQIQIMEHADGQRRGNKLIGVCAPIRTSSQSLVQGLVSFKF